MPEDSIQPDVSAYIPKGKSKGSAVSRRTKTPITFTEDTPKGEIGDFDSGSTPKSVLNFLSVLPHIAAALGPSMTVNPAASLAHGIPVDETIGHENVHALEAEEPVDIKSMPSFNTMMPLLTSATGSSDPDELPAYASQPTQGNRILGQSGRQSVIQQFMQKLSPAKAATFAGIAQR